MFFQRLALGMLLLIFAVFGFWKLLPAVSDWLDEASFAEKDVSAEEDLSVTVDASTLDPDVYPQALISLLERNPETAQFVLDYPEKKDLHAEIDLTDEVKKGTIPLFLQWDERWGYETYGSSFMAVTACGPTSLSMVYCGLTGDTVWNPYKMAAWAEESGYYVWGEGSSWELMTTGAEQLGLTSESLSVDASAIRAALRAKKPVICSVGPGDFTNNGHFIVLTGLTWKGKVRVNDPNSRINSETLWDMDRLVSQMSAAWAYSCNG